MSGVVWRGVAWCPGGMVRDSMGDRAHPRIHFGSRPQLYISLALGAGEGVRSPLLHKCARPAPLPCSADNRRELCCRVPPRSSRAMLSCAAESRRELTSFSSLGLWLPSRAQKLAVDVPMHFVDTNGGRIVASSKYNDKLKSITINKYKA